MTRLRHRLCVLMLGAATAGCTVGPDFKAPAPPTVAHYTREPVTPAGIHLVPGQNVPADWWTLFRSPALDSLIRQAMENNPDLQSARATLDAALESVKAQQGFQYPAMGLGLSANRNSETNILSPTLASDILLYNLYQTQLNVSWAPDLWGGNRRQVEALQAAADAQRYQLQALHLALAANIVNAAIQEAALREEITATQRIIDDTRTILSIMERQQVLGQIAGSDVAAQKVQLAQAEAALPPLQKQLATERDQLKALVGRFPADTLPQTFHLSDLTLPAALPLSVPARLTAQRPDIRAAEAYMHAANAEIGVTIADMLPNIVLSADIGSVATSLSRLASSGSGFWGLGAGLAQPLFAGGTLLHRSRAARAAYEAAAAQYRSTVTAAFQNVADVLHTINADDAVFRSTVLAETQARRGLEITRQQVRLGQTSKLALLQSDQMHLQAVIAQTQAQAARLADSVALLQALGGGWWNASDQPNDAHHATAPVMDRKPGAGE